MTDEFNVDYQGDPIWGEEWIQTYLEVGDRYSMENESLHTGFMLALLSQTVPQGHFYLGDDRKRTRIHPIMIQDSGSGKDPAFNFAKEVARRSSMSFIDSNNVTNAGFVGSFDDDGEKIPGIAERGDIIGFREATQLFKSAKTDYNANLAENLNAVLDGSKVERPMAAGVIEFIPSCTVVATTYPPSGKHIDVENLMRNGTLARFLYFHKEITTDDRFKISKRLVERAGEDTDVVTRNRRVDELSYSLDTITCRLEIEQEFTLEIDTEEVKERMEQMMQKELAATGHVAREAVEPAIGRYHIHALRIGCLLAALDECKTVVEDKHIERAMEFVARSWSEMLQFFQRYFHKGEKRDQNGKATLLHIISTLLNAADEPISQSELAEQVGVSTRTIRKHTSELTSVGIIEEHGSPGKTKSYSLKR